MTKPLPSINLKNLVRQVITEQRHSYILESPRTLEEGVYDPENQESRPKLSREEMVSKTVEELEEEYRSFGCTDLGATASADAKSYCNMLKGGISTKQNVSLQEIIKQEVKAVLSEQLATFRHGFQQRSDFDRELNDSGFMRKIRSLTKQQFYKLISSLKANSKDPEDIYAKRRLKLVMAGFPYNLKDGQVASLADLKTLNTATKNTQPTED